MAYERLDNDRFTLNLTCDKALSQVMVRFGPFPSNVRRVEIIGEGQRDRITCRPSGNGNWASKVFRNIRTLELSARPSF